MNKTKMVKVSVSSTLVNKYTSKLFEFFVIKEPPKEIIKEVIEETLDIKLEIRNYDPIHGGDFGAFFYNGAQHITYHFKEVELLEI